MYNVFPSGPPNAAFVALRPAEIVPGSAPDGDRTWTIPSPQVTWYTLSAQSIVPPSVPPGDAKSLRAPVLPSAFTG